MNCLVGQKLVKSHLGAAVALVQVRQPAREVPYIAGCIDHPNGNGGDNTWLFFCNYDAFGIIVYYSQLHTYHQVIIGSIQALVGCWRSWFLIGIFQLVLCIFLPHFWMQIPHSKIVLPDTLKNEKSQIDTLCKKIDFIYSGKKPFLKNWAEGAAKLKIIIGNFIWQYILSSEIC